MPIPISKLCRSISEDSTKYPGKGGHSNLPGPRGYHQCPVVTMSGQLGEKVQARGGKIAVDAQDLLHDALPARAARPLAQEEVSFFLGADDFHRLGGRRVWRGGRLFRAVELGNAGRLGARRQDCFGLFHDTRLRFENAGLALSVGTATEKQRGRDPVRSGAQ